jgi:uncharacterized membrane protein
MLELLLGLAPILLAATALLATPFGLPVLSWLIGNPIGRVVAIVGIVIMSLWLAFQLGRKDGVSRIRAQETVRNLDALRERIAVDESIRSMKPAERREELRKWVR